MDGRRRRQNEQLNIVECVLCIYKENQMRLCIITEHPFLLWSRNPPSISLNGRQCCVEFVLDFHSYFTYGTINRESCVHSYSARYNGDNVYSAHWNSSSLDWVSSNNVWPIYWFERASLQKGEETEWQETSKRWFHAGRFRKMWIDRYNEYRIVVIVCCLAPLSVCSWILEWIQKVLSVCGWIVATFGWNTFTA